MRQIKFKFWSPVKNEWENTASIEVGSNGEFIHLYCEPFIPLQFTGILDNNGKEIYEGDILQDINHPFCKEPVFWATTENDYDLDGWLCEHFYPSSKYEIIGNIYENPQLLEK